MGWGNSVISSADFPRKEMVPLHVQLSQRLKHFEALKKNIFHLKKHFTLYLRETLDILFIRQVTGNSNIEGVCT